MRVQRLIMWTTAILVFIVHAPSDVDGNFEAVHRKTKIYRIAILPICALGAPCDPALPHKLARDFFKDDKGIKRFISDLSNGHVLLKGTATSWLHIKKKLRNEQEVAVVTEDLILLAGQQLQLNDFDIFILYINVRGFSKSASWPPGQLMSVENKEISPGIIFIFNAENHQLVDKNKSGLLPSVDFAKELLHVLGFSKSRRNLVCDDYINIQSCHLKTASNQFVDDNAQLFMLSPNWAMKRTLRWSKENDIKLVDKNGVYQIDARSAVIPKALEIKFAAPLKLNDSISFNGFFIEAKNNHFQKTRKNLSRQTAPSTNAVFYFAHDSIGNAPIDFSPREITKNTLKLFHTGIAITLLNSTKTSLTVMIDGLSSSRK